MSNHVRPAPQTENLARILKAEGWSPIEWVLLQSSFSDRQKADGFADPLLAIRYFQVKYELLFLAFQDSAQAEGEHYISDPFR